MTKRRLAAFSLVIALSLSLSALLSSRLQGQQADNRVKQIGGKFMCMCSCNQVLTQCNHIGCTTSTSMLKELNQAVARGDSETDITQGFIQEFGTKVYAEPPKSGLSLVAWVLPSVYLLVGTLLVIFIISRWRSRLLTPAAAGPSGVTPEELERARRRVARDTED